MSNNGMSVPQVAAPQLQAQPPALAIKVQEGGLILVITYPYLMTQLIIPEDTIPALVKALEENAKKIPRVTLG